MRSSMSRKGDCWDNAVSNILKSIKIESDSIQAWIIQVQKTMKTRKICLNYVSMGEPHLC